MAPEVIKGQHYDTSADIWSVGITIIEMVKARPPRHELHWVKALMEIPHNPPPTLEGDFDPQLIDLVRMCLQKKPNQRPTAAECLEHPFIANLDPSLNPLENLIRDRLQQDDEPVDEDELRKKSRRAYMSNALNPSADDDEWNFTIDGDSATASVVSSMGSSNNGSGRHLEKIPTTTTATSSRRIKQEKKIKKQPANKQLRTNRNNNRTKKKEGRHCSRDTSRSSRHSSRSSNGNSINLEHTPIIPLYVNNLITTISEDCRSGGGRAALSKLRDHLIEIHKAERKRKRKVAQQRNHLKETGGHSGTSGHRSTRRRKDGERKKQQRRTRRASNAVE